MNPISYSTPDNGVRLDSTAQPVSFSDDERILLDAIAAGLRPRYLSAKAPSLVALVHPTAGVLRYVHPDFPAANGRPMACTEPSCPLCAARVARSLAVAVPFIDLETRTPGFLPLRLSLMPRDGRPVPSYRSGSIEEAVHLTSTGGPVAVKFERGGDGYIIGRRVVVPGELAYADNLAGLLFDWFAASSAEIGLLLVAQVEPAEILKDQRLKRRLAAAAL